MHYSVRVTEGRGIKEGLRNEVRIIAFRIRRLLEGIVEICPGREYGHIWKAPQRGLLETWPLGWAGQLHGSTLTPTANYRLNVPSARQGSGIWGSRQGLVSGPAVRFFLLSMVHTVGLGVARG